MNNLMKNNYNSPTGLTQNILEVEDQSKGKFSSVTKELT